MAFTQAWAFAVALALALLAVVLPDDLLPMRVVFALFASANLLLALWYWA